MAARSTKKKAKPLPRAKKAARRVKKKRRTKRMRQTGPVKRARGSADVFPKSGRYTYAHQKDGSVVIERNGVVVMVMPREVFDWFRSTEGAAHS